MLSLQSLATHNYAQNYVLQIDLILFISIIITDIMNGKSDFQVCWCNDKKWDS